MLTELAIYPIKMHIKSAYYLHQKVIIYVIYIFNYDAKIALNVFFVQFQKVCANKAP